MLFPRLLLLAVGIILISLPMSDVWAEHEADHRYTVEGFVLDTQENPRPAVNVLVTADEGLLGRDVTDRRGFYKIQLHLHNTALGKKLTVKAGGHESEIEVTFDPTDKHTARIHNLNFIGGRATPADLGFRGFPTWLYVLVGGFAAAVVASMARMAAKKRRKRRERDGKAQRKKKRKNPRRKPRRRS